MPSGHPPSPKSLIVGNCIACSGLVRVSATANATANVRCPHCQQTFPLANLLESAVPEVEVVESQVAPPLRKNHQPPQQHQQHQQHQQKQKLYIDQTAETTKDASGKFVVPSQLSKGARRRKSSRSRSDSSRSRSSSRSSETERSSSRERDSRSRSDDAARRRTRPSEDESRDTNRSRSTSSESRDREQESQQSANSHRSTRHRDARAAEALKAAPNPVVDFLKVITGAILALPIAYLIVMWVFTVDPVGIAGGLGEKIPFLVPADLRNKTESENDNPSATEQGFIDFNDEESSPDSFESFNFGGEALKGFEL